MAKKYFSLKPADKIVKISIDRLKPAYILNDECFTKINPVPEHCDSNAHIGNENNNNCTTEKPALTRTTRSGRSVKRPV